MCTIDDPGSGVGAGYQVEILCFSKARGCPASFSFRLVKTKICGLK